MIDLVILFLVVLGIHLTPALTPPTWPVIVLYSLTVEGSVLPTVVVAAVAATVGRYALARFASLFASRLPERSWRNLATVRALLEQRRGRIAALGLFLVTPLPSAQLFEAAGIAGVRMLPYSTAYFVGRLGYYGFYAFVAERFRSLRLGEQVRDGLTSPAGIAIQIALVGLIAAFVLADWSKWLGRRGRERP